MASIREMASGVVGEGFVHARPFQSAMRRGLL
jgi:hypothetical protein